MCAKFGNETDLLAIDRVRDVHVRALNSGDAGAWTELFAEDGVQMPPNAPANIGKERIGHWSAGLLGAFRVRFGLQVDEVRVLGDWAFERGDYTINLQPRAGHRGAFDRGPGQVRYHLSEGWRRPLADGSRHLEQQHALTRLI